MSLDTQKKPKNLSLHPVSDLMSRDFLLENEELVSMVLQRHIPHHEVWAVGDRTGLNVDSYMDLELIVISPHSLSEELMRSLKSACRYFVGSLQVDIFEWCALSSEDQGRVLENYVVFQKPSEAMV